MKLYILSLIHIFIEVIERQIEECRNALIAMCQEHFPKQFKRLQSIPGVKERAASAIIAEKMCIRDSTNNPDAVLTYESENESNLDRVYAKGMRANGTPLSAYSLALDYNVKGWFFNLTGNYYDRVYIDFSSYRRLGSVLDKNGAGVDANGNPVLHVPGQEKLRCV